MAVVVGTNSYVTRDEANTYFNDAIHADAWRDADNKTKDQSIVTAYRMLERQRWQGDLTDPVTPQVQAWPRTGLVDIEDLPLDDQTVPQEVKAAQTELSLSLIQNEAVQTQDDTSTNIKKLVAGSAQIEYFRGESGPRFPTIVNELIGMWLEGAFNYAVPFMSDTSLEARIESYPLTRGY